MNLDPYYYCREHDGSGWSVRGPNGFCLKKTNGPLDKSVAYCIAKLLPDQFDDAPAMLRDLPVPDPDGGYRRVGETR